MHSQTGHFHRFILRLLNRCLATLLTLLQSHDFLTETDLGIHYTDKNATTPLNNTILFFHFSCEDGTHTFEVIQVGGGVNLYLCSCLCASCLSVHHQYAGFHTAPAEIPKYSQVLGLPSYSLFSLKCERLLSFSFTPITQKPEETWSVGLACWFIMTGRVNAISVRMRYSWQMWTNRILIDFASIVASDQSHVSVSLLTALKSQLRVRNTAAGETRRENPESNAWMVEKIKEETRSILSFFSPSPSPPLSQCKRILLHRWGIGENRALHSSCCSKLHYSIKPKLNGPAHTLHNALQSFTNRWQHTHIHSLWSPWKPPWMVYSRYEPILQKRQCRCVEESSHPSTY